MKFMQRLGKSMMLPVSVLPIAAILMGISYWIATAVGGDNIAGVFLGAAGGALLDNMPILFAVGISIGMASKSDGTSALAGLVSWLTITTLLAPGAVAGYLGIEVDAVNPAFGKVQNVFVFLHLHFEGGVLVTKGDIAALQLCKLQARFFIPSFDKEITHRFEAVVFQHGYSLPEFLE